MSNQRAVIISWIMKKEKNSNPLFDRKREHGIGLKRYQKNDKYG